MSSHPQRRIGVCSWSLRPREPRELVAALQRLGMNAVQLALSPLVHAPAVWADAIGLLHSAGIDILSGMMAMRGEDYATLQSIARTGGVRPDADWPANREHAKAVAALAQHHAIELVTFHAGFIPHDASNPERATLLDRLGVVADVFAERGVSLAFETGQETAATLMEALEALGRRNVGVNFDPANMILYGMGDPIESLRLLAPRVRQVHVKDALPARMPGTWGAEVAVGHGAVDWPRFFQIAMTIRPAVNFIIEREAGGERHRDVLAARDLITRHTGECESS
jgi:L-ribulose-5-phosphate 3-epimerase